MIYSALIVIYIAWTAAVHAHPTQPRISFSKQPRASFTKQNGVDAISLNIKFASLTASSMCTAGQNACVNNQFAQCVGGKFVTSTCGSGEVCAALPLVNSAGTSIACTTPSDLVARIKATGAQVDTQRSMDTKPTQAAMNAVAAGKSTKTSTQSAAKTTASSKTGATSGDPQTSLTLDSSVIAKGFAQNGQSTPAAGQIASLTSTNNFINFCVGKTITNGQQITNGSCNPAPMGSIPSTANMPSSKFVFPKNLDTIPSNTTFNITMAIQNMNTGNFVNADQNFYAAPQQLNENGQIMGHSHVVVEAIDSLTSTKPSNPAKFTFFKGLNIAAAGGVLTANVPSGLPAGTYKLSSINTAANHQPVLVPIAQRGSLDDTVYFTVSDSGKAITNGVTTTATTKTNKKNGGAKAASSTLINGSKAISTKIANSGRKGN